MRTIVFTAYSVIAKKTQWWVSDFAHLYIDLIPDCWALYQREKRLEVETGADTVVAELQSWVAYLILRLQSKKKLAVLPSPAGISLTKFSLVEIL